jgi:uncharacterized membrane protein (DUF485 family)
LTVVEEKDLASRVAEVMTTLDEVKKYKELARSLADFALIIISAIIVVLFVYIGIDSYQALGGQFTQGLIISGLEGIISLLIIAGGLIAGVLWIGRRTSRVRVGEWKKELVEPNSTIGAMKLLAGLDWPTVFQDIRYSKLGFVFYSILKVIGYWILTFVILELILSFGLGILHIMPNLAYDAILSLIIAVAFSRKDLQRRYNQSWALDSLLWELRWFESEFRGKAGEIGSTTSKA